jgi:hypothetical protein
MTILLNEHHIYGFSEKLQNNTLKVTVVSAPAKPKLV